MWNSDKTIFFRNFKRKQEFNTTKIWPSCLLTEKNVHFTLADEALRNKLGLSVVR